MNETDIAVKLENHDQQIKSLKHRMEEQQGDRLAKLEAAPAEQWSSMKRTIFNTMVGAMAGALATGLIYIMAQYIK